MFLFPSAYLEIVHRQSITNSGETFIWIYPRAVACGRLNVICAAKSNVQLNFSSAATDHFLLTLYSFRWTYIRFSYEIIYVRISIICWTRDSKKLAHLLSFDLNSRQLEKDRKRTPLISLMAPKYEQLYVHHWRGHWHLHHSVLVHTCKQLRGHYHSNVGSSTCSLRDTVRVSSVRRDSEQKNHAGLYVRIWARAKLRVLFLRLSTSNCRQSSLRTNKQQTTQRITTQSIKHTS